MEDFVAYDSKDIWSSWLQLPHGKNNKRWRKKKTSIFVTLSKRCNNGKGGKWDWEGKRDRVERENETENEAYIENGRNRGEMKECNIVIGRDIERRMRTERKKEI